MKTTPHLLLAAALALGTSFAIAQDENKPPLPPRPDAPPRPPEAGRPEMPRPPERERARDDRDRRDGRPGEVDRRDTPRGEVRRDGPRDEHRDGPRGDDRRDGPRGDERRDEPRGDDRRDGPGAPGERHHGPDAGRGPEMSRRMPMPPPAPPKPTSYLGVVTVPPPAVIAAQFGLSPGFGLVVSEVLPDSPAAKAGVQKYDVLTKFNDQQLVDGGQFSTLVRAQAKDSDATLTLFRKAKEEKVSVKIGEKMMPERRQFPKMGEFHDKLEQWKGPAMDNLKKFQDRAREYGDRMREFQERMKDWSRKPTAEMPQPPQFEAGEMLRLNSGDVLREVQPGGAAVVSLLQPDGAVTYHTRDAKMLMKDDSGEVEVSLKDGQRQLIAKDAQGAVVFEGTIDTEEQRKALPEDIRKKVELIEAQTKIVRFDAPAFVPAEIEDDVQ
jgi:hypothetical protein